MVAGLNHAIINQLEGIQKHTKGGMADEKITFGKTGNFSSDNLDAVGLYLVGRR